MPRQQKLRNCAHCTIPISPSIYVQPLIFTESRWFCDYNCETAYREEKDSICVWNGLLIKQDKDCYFRCHPYADRYDEIHYDWHEIPKQIYDCLMAYAISQSLLF